jgi:hypothetical protein
MYVNVIGTLSVYLPLYSHKFHGAAKNAGGWYDKEKKCYIFDAKSESIVRQLLMDVYGMDGTPREMFNIKMTAKREFVKYRSIELLARQIIIANKFKEPRLGKGVLLLSGKIRSGRSEKRPWTVIVEEGTELIVYDMPNTALRGDSADWTIEVHDIKPHSLDREALEAELNQIRAREKQIIEILNYNKMD